MSKLVFIRTEKKSNSVSRTRKHTAKRPAHRESSGKSWEMVNTFEKDEFVMITVSVVFNCYRIFVSFLTHISGIARVKSTFLCEMIMKLRYKRHRSMGKSFLQLLTSAARSEFSIKVKVRTCQSTTSGGLSC